MDTTKSDTNKPRVKYVVDIMIPPECLDEDGGKCEHDRKTEKKEQNPV